MATFPRSASHLQRQIYFQLPPNLRAAAFPCRSTTVSPPSSLRSFTSTTSFARSSPSAGYKAASPSTAAKVPSKALPVKPYEAKEFAPGGAAIAVLNQLTTSKEPTLLYQAPSQIGFRITAYSASFACFGAAAFTYKYLYLDLPPGLGAWISAAFASIAVTWSGVGTYLAAAPVGVVKTITAVPMKVAGGQGRDLLLRVEVAKLPGLNSVFEVPASQLTIDDSIADIKSGLYEVKRSVAEGGNAKQSDPLLLRPFTALGRFCSKLLFSLMHYTKMTIMRQGFLRLTIRGKGAYKLDTAGWLYRDGRALAQLIKVV